MSIQRTDRSNSKWTENKYLLVAQTFWNYNPSKTIHVVGRRLLLQVIEQEIFSIIWHRGCQISLIRNTVINRREPSILITVSHLYSNRAEEFRGPETFLVFLYLCSPIKALKPSSILPQEQHLKRICDLFSLYTV